MSSKSVCIVSINVHLRWQSTHWKEGHKIVSQPQNSAQLATVYSEKIAYTVVWMFSNRHVMYLSTKETPKHKKSKFVWILSACCIARAGQYINIDKLSGLNSSRIGTRKICFLIDSCSMQTCLNILWLQNACSFHIHGSERQTWTHQTKVQGICWVKCLLFHRKSCNLKGYSPKSKLVYLNIKQSRLTWIDFNMSLPLWVYGFLYTRTHTHKHPVLLERKRRNHW